MSLTKKVQGDYNINTVDADGDVANNVTITTSSLNVAGNVTTTNDVTIGGDLTVSGTTTTVNSTDVEVADKTILLNKGETGAGVTSPVHSGIEIERGTATNVGIRYNDTSDAWELTNNGTAWDDIAGTSALGIKNVVEDTTPQLGGNLDVNGMTITSSSNGDVVLDANGTGQLKVNHVVSLEDQWSAPSSTASYNKLYSATPGEGGTGLYFVNTSSSDELVSKTKAMVYGLIF